MLHCAGKIRRMPNEPGGPALAYLDRSRFTDAALGNREAFYGQMTAVIGERVFLPRG